jgi:hypothetical protein
MSLHASTGLRNRVRTASKHFASTFKEDSMEKKLRENPSTLISDKCFRFSYFLPLYIIFLETISYVIFKVPTTVRINDVFCEVPPCSFVEKHVK